MKRLLLGTSLLWVLALPSVWGAEKIILDFVLSPEGNQVILANGAVSLR